MLNKIIQQVKKINFWFAILFYLFVALTVSYIIVALVLAAENNLNWPPIVLMISCVVGITVGMFVVFFLSKFKTKLFSAHMDAFNLHPINTWFVVIVFGIALLMLVFSIQFASCWAEMKAVMENWAEVLLIFGSLASIGGLFFTACSIRQYRRQITSFSAFAKRLKHMIYETSGDSDEDYVRIMAYTPIPGSLALEESVYDGLREKIMKDDARLEIVCLNEEDLSQWFNKFEKKRYRNGEITKGKIDRAKKDINHLIERVDNPDSPAKKMFAKKHKSKRLKANQLPDFYFFFNNIRALVTTPFFFPMVPDIVACQNKVNIEFENEPVEMIGFETTDAKIIENIKKFYMHFHD